MTATTTTSTPATGREQVGDTPGAGTDAVTKVLAELAAHLDTDREANIGFPSTFDIDYTPLWPFLNRVLNNVGDPFQDSAFPANTKHLERDVLAWFATLLRAPLTWWGVCTSGGTEGIEYGLVHARTRYPDGLVLHSSAGHYSIPKLVAKLRMAAVTVRAGADGQLDHSDLREVIRAHRDKPLIIIATAGTTMTEAVDDVGLIRTALAEVPVQRAYIHVDAALSGPPLALLAPNCRPAFDLADGADSVSVSAHKFLGCPFPAGVYLTGHPGGPGERVDYIATTDTTLAGSRSGHAPLIIWYAINTHGIDGLRRRAEDCRRVAAYAVSRLEQIGWPAWRYPYACTVVLDTPPAPIATKWRLASSNGQSHLICLPGITTTQIDALTGELARHRGVAAIAGPARRTPAPRSARYPNPDRADEKEYRR